MIFHIFINQTKFITQMKKLMTFAAMFAAVSMMFSACDEKDPQGNEPTPGPGTENEIPETNSAIQIDGLYADWDALTDVQVATCPADDVLYEQFKTFKVYADEEFIHIFCEFEPENTLEFVPYFDLDNDPATGNDSKWSGAGYEAKAEGSVFEEITTDDGSEQGAAHKWDPAFYHYTDSGTEKVLDSGMAVISSVPAPYKGSTWAFEASILREVVLEAYGIADATQFTLGMYQYDLDWACIGQLPCKTFAQKEAGELEPMLTVTLP